MIDMTQEERQLQLKDLSARLPYGVKFQGEDSNVYTLDAANYFALQVEDVVFKPYLRPMSSMTEEEKEEYRNLSDEVIGSYGPYHHEFIVHCVRLGIKPDNPHECVDNFLNMEAIDWLNAHHFDYRGLIEKGLALEAPEGMYK